MRAVRPTPAAALSIALLLTAGALALALPLGSGGDESAPPLRSLVSVRDLQLYDCAGWRASDLEERRAVLATLRRNSGQPVPGRIGASASGTVLAADQAAGLLDRHCARAGSDRFLLYKLYGWAAGFAGEAP